jgi:hypothetical protein
VPVTTQWELVHRAAEALGGVLEALCGAAAGGEVVHNDDTTMTILGFDPAACFDPVSDGERAARRGVYSSGIVAQAGGQQIALFFTGRRHAGENLARLLARREQDRPPPIQRCDGLAHNTAGAFETLVANCLAQYLESDVIRSTLTRCRARVGGRGQSLWIRTGHIQAPPTRVPVACDAGCRPCCPETIGSVVSSAHGERTGLETGPSASTCSGFGASASTGARARSTRPLG